MFKPRQNLKQKLISTGILLSILSLVGLVKLPLTVSIKEFANPIFAFVNSITGHSLSGLTVLCIGIFPITNASILISLLSTIVPSLSRLKTEGAYGREKLSRITKYLAYVLGFIMSNITVTYLSKVNLLPSVSFSCYSLYVACLFIGVVLTQKISDKITEVGLIDGMSSIIFVNLTKSLLCNSFNTIKVMQISLGFVIVKVLLTILLFVLVYNLLKQEFKIPAHIVTKKSMECNSTYFNIKVLNCLPQAIIFVSMLILLPQVVFNIKFNSLISYILIIVFSIICYKVALSTQYNTNLISHNLAKSNVYLDGINQGKETEKFLDKLLLKDSLIGGIITASIFIISSSINSLLLIDITSMFIFVTIASSLLASIKSLRAVESYKGFLI